MRLLNESWRGENQILKTQTRSAETSFRSYKESLNDTANYAAKLARSDSAWTKQARRIENDFQDWFGRWMACIRDLETQVEENTVWLNEITEHPPRKVLAIRSWEARKDRFARAKLQCSTIASQAREKQSAVQSLKNRILPI
jgi:hypothetical protein